jgi:HCOMODA/2-hydroxy-3-carboxy-muconic semialdehyde decarboxylase
MSQDDKALHRKLRMAARALGRAGLVHAYGHCSVRPANADQFLVCAPKPMGSIKPSDENQWAPVRGELPEGVLGEVRIHQFIYQQRPEIHAVCRIMSPKVMSLSTLGQAPKPRHGLGAYFGADIPVWQDPRLLRDDASAEQLINHMGNCNAVIMRGNGAVVAGESLEEALAYAFFLEDAARVELEVRAIGVGANEGLLNAEEIVARQVKAGRVFDRMWRHLTDGDPEQGS